MDWPDDDATPRGRVAFPSIDPKRADPSTPRRRQPASPIQSVAFEPVTPNKTRPTSPFKSPSKSPSKRARGFPQRFDICLNAQRHSILRALSKPVSFDLVDEEEEDSYPNAIAHKSLSELLDGTVSRGEGNSCLVIGPRGSGKTQLVESCLQNCSRKAIIIRLSAHAQISDRLAMREVAYQLTQQTGAQYLFADDGEDEDQDPDDADKEDHAPTKPLDNDDDLFGDNDDDNPFIVKSTQPTAKVVLPPAAHLPALISTLTSLTRPVIVILEAFDLFALHPRQSLLYCLLDTVQSCRGRAFAMSGVDPSIDMPGLVGHGLCVIGVTTRIDTLMMLEKRVKSRFSGRTILVTGPRTSAQCRTYADTVLRASIESEMSCAPEVISQWDLKWGLAIDAFFGDESVENLFDEIFGISKDARLLQRILLGLATALCPAIPFPTAAVLEFVISTQCRRLDHAYIGGKLHSLILGLTYPAICLLVSWLHWDTSGHPIVNFEMLNDTFRTQVRMSQAAPVQVNGVSIGMIRCSRQAFEDLVSTRVFIGIAAPSDTVTPEFVRYRCAVERNEICRVAMEHGQEAVKRWAKNA
ncbi:hypothetical protein FISHEDRAFT_41901 [Fistulina hepatica ATCC 64428]|nr:hypothetical protein FISHEDRAFT_41901 [Fistulina hepatica ATCC 64428]